MTDLDRSSVAGNPPGEEAESPSARPVASSDRLPHPALFPVLVFAGTWVLILVTWRASAIIYHRSMPWATYFSYKDAAAYFWIAQHGYTTLPGGNPPGAIPSTIAYFPLLPFLVRGVSYLTVFAGSQRYLWAGLIVEVLAGAASCVMVWLLAGRVSSRRVADRSVILYCAFPGAMTFGMLYTEPLAAALIAACLLAAVNRKWLLAGTLALLATAEHPPGIILVPVLGVIALREIWTRRDWRSLIAPALAPFGMLAYFAWMGTRYHDYLIWFHVEQKYWRTHFDFGVHEFHLLTWTYPPAWKYGFFDVLMAVLFTATVIGCALLLRACLPLSVTLYTLVLFGYLVLASAAVKPRAFWELLGIFIGAAAVLPRWLYWPVAIASAGLLAFCVGWWPQHPIGPAP